MTTDSAAVSATRNMRGLLVRVTGAGVIPRSKRFATFCRFSFVADTLYISMSASSACAIFVL